MSSTAYETHADAATILARVDEATIAYSLPAPVRIRAYADRGALFDRPEDAQVRETMSKLPPLLIIRLKNEADMHAWAGQLDCEISARTDLDDGRYFFMLTAIGRMLGWFVSVTSDRDTYRDVTPPAPLNIVRRAHLGVI
jgi:hypothetical protein